MTDTGTHTYFAAGDRVVLKLPWGPEMIIACLAVRQISIGEEALCHWWDTRNRLQTAWIPVYLLKWAAE